MMGEQVPRADVGNVSELNGVARIVRDEPVQASLEANIKSYDTLETSNGRMGITFLDDTQIRLTEHSQVLVDEFVFDPNPDNSKMALNFAKGTARFVTGKLGLVPKKNIKIRTNSATIGIRGTDFTITVNEIGESLIILLPNLDGTSSGEIEVTTAMGTVLLNKPYESTVTTVFEAPPSNPVILDLTLDIIDNMLIVNPPERVRETIEETTSSSSNVLDVDFLEFDELDADYFAKDELEFTELDINYLDVNFFEDLLKVIDELDKLAEDDLEQEQQITRIVGTKVGQDPTTQIITLVQGEVISLRRKVEQSVQVDLNSSQGYTVIFIQDGVSNTIKINGGGDSVIKITQGS
tara:strand:- start:1641 stop:2693 length:1053 start_codon:yes stop_codon:yes gene_type:complete